MRSTFKHMYAAISTLSMVMIAQVSADCNTAGYCETTCCETEACKVTLTGELLYWRPELCGLESAFGTTEIATTVNGDIVTTAVAESDKEPDFKWDAGFRIGADVAFNCFDLELDWTHFKGKGKFHEDRQHGHYNIDYDVIDLTLGRSFCVAPCFYVKPFIGVRGARIHQKLRSHLETLFTAVIGDNTVFTDIDDKENFWGIGPQIGLDADWYLGCNFSLYGSFAVVTYYGDVKGRSHHVDTFTRTVSECHGKNKHCFNNIATDAAIGIRWETCTTCFCGCEMDLMLKLGLEQHRIYDFSNLGSDGELSLDGGVFAAGVGFNY